MSLDLLHWYCLLEHVFTADKLESNVKCYDSQYSIIFRLSLIEGKDILYAIINMVMWLQKRKRKSITMAFETFDWKSYPVVDKDEFRIEEWLSLTI